ncbi:MAG: PAS domain-containing protein [Bacteroidota bacterium]
MKEWFGLPPGTDIELPHAINTIAEKDRQRIVEAIQKALDYSSGGNYEVEYSIINPVTKKQIIVQAKGKAWFNDEKVAYRFNGTLQDVTEHVLTRRIIEESEEKFRTMAESADILIGVNDETGNAVYFNNAWSLLTGRPVEELLQFGWPIYFTRKIMIPF